VQFHFLKSSALNQRCSCCLMWPRGPSWAINRLHPAGRTPFGVIYHSPILSRRPWSSESFAQILSNTYWPLVTSHVDAGAASTLISQPPVPCHDQEFSCNAKISKTLHQFRPTPYLNPFLFIFARFGRDQVWFETSKIQRGRYLAFYNLSVSVDSSTIQQRHHRMPNKRNSDTTGCDHRLVPWLAGIICSSE